VHSSINFKEVHKKQPNDLQIDHRPLPSLETTSIGAGFLYRVDLAFHPIEFLEQLEIFLQ